MRRERQHQRGLLGLGLLGALGLVCWAWPRRRRSLGGVHPEATSHYAKKKREPIPAYFVDPETGEIIELDLRTAKYRREGETEFRGPDMLTLIASESRSPEEFARRAEAWASTEAKPPSITKLAAAYRRAKPGIVAKLIRAARERRLSQTRARWQSLIAQREDA